MKKIILVNAWEEFDEALKYLEEGGDQYPLHHFFGYDALKNGTHPIECFKYNQHTWLNRFGNYLGLNNLQQQIDCIKRQKEYDIIYDPFMEFTYVLSFLRALGLFRKPIVSLAFRAYVLNRGSFIKIVKEFFIRFGYLRGTDAILFATKSLFEKSGEFIFKGNTTYANHWGVDHDFFNSYCEAQPEPPTNDYVFTTGSTSRDFKTLVKAFCDLDIKLKIIPKRAMEYPKDWPFSENVFIDNNIPIGMESTGLLRKHYYNALAIAVPQTNNRWFKTHGITVLFEGMACGKPVITTNNKSYNIDVEKEKIGFNIDFYDVKGWKDAIQYLIDYPDEARAMGERAAYLSKTKYNYKLFSKEIVEHIYNSISKQFSDEKLSTLKAKGTRVISSDLNNYNNTTQVANKG